MFEREQTLYQFQLNYIKLLSADLEDGKLHETPFPGANPPVWILGHLAVCTDYAARMLGEKPVLPRDWHKQFAPGSNPQALEPPYPTKAELLAALEAGHQRVVNALPAASTALLDQPHAVELLKPTNLKTNGDVLAHLMSTHVAFHVAQLSACRRGLGKGPII
jgi:hypothetical protein